MSTALQKKINLEALKIEQMYKSEFKRAYTMGAKESMARSFSVLFYVLHNKHGFGEKRLKAIADEILYLCDCMDKDLVSLEDMRQVLVDECNVDIYKKIMDEK